MDIVFSNYEIQSTSDDSLNKTFTVKSSYKNEKISLQIDLRQMDPMMANSSVSGTLIIKNREREAVQYDIKFLLLCSEKEFCAQTKVHTEENASFKGVAISTEQS